MLDTKTYLGNGELQAIESLYKTFITNPELLDMGWRKFFEGFEFAQTDMSTIQIPALQSGGTATALAKEITSMFQT